MMNDFDYDCYQKKIISRSASKRVGQRKGCRLPSDNLTKAQKAKLSGEVVVVNLKQPITWEKYKALPKELAIEYYNNLVTEYKVGEGKIAHDLFGISKTSLMGYNRRHDLPVMKCNKGRWSGFDRKKWETFLGRPLEIRAVEEADEAVEEVEEMVEETVEETVEEVVEEQKDNSTLNGFRFVFEDVTDMTEITNLIGNLPLPKNARVYIEVKKGD